MQPLNNFSQILFLLILQVFLSRSEDVLFGCNPQIIFLFLSSQFELSDFLAQLLPTHIYTGYLVNATPPTSLVQSSFFNFAGVFVND